MASSSLPARRLSTARSNSASSIALDGVARRGPSEPRGLLAGRALVEFVETGQAALGGAQHLQRVEGGHPRTSLVEIDAREGEQHAAARRAGGQTQREALSGDAGLLEFEIVAEAFARGVGQNRILGELFRKDALGQAGDDHDVEIETAKVVCGGDHHRAVAPPGRGRFEPAEPLGEHLAHFIKADRPHRRHRLELG